MATPQKIVAPIVTPGQAAGRKVTRTLTIDPGVEALTVAIARANRADPPMTWDQVEPTFTVERIAGPRDTNARWRFNIPGQLLVVAEQDLPIIEALINAIKAERDVA